MRGDERVSQFRDGRETGQFSVEREPESLAARVAQGQETGLGGTGLMSVGRDELHRALKIGERDRGILRRHFLIRPVIDAVARELLPVARPVAAEPAIAVIDQQWPGTDSWRFSSVGGRISGCLLHDFNYICADSRLGAFGPGLTWRPRQTGGSSVTNDAGDYFRENTIEKAILRILGLCTLFVHIYQREPRPKLFSDLDDAGSDRTRNSGNGSGSRDRCLIVLGLSPRPRCSANMSHASESCCQM